MMGILAVIIFGLFGLAMHSMYVSGNVTSADAMLIIMALTPLLKGVFEGK